MVINGQAIINGQGAVNSGLVINGNTGGGIPPVSYLSAGLAVQPWAVWGFEQFKETYTGPAIRLRRASDNAESDFSFLASGQLDYSAISTWAGGASYVDTLYDLTGNGHHIIQATNGNQPTFAPTGINSKGAADFVPASSNYMTLADDISSATGKTFAAVYHPDSAIAADQRLLQMINDAPGGNLIASHLTTTAGQTGYFDTAFKNIAAATSTAQLMVWHLASGTGTMYRNNSSIGSSTYTDKATVSTTAHKIGTNVGAGGAFYDGKLSFLAIWESAIDSTDRSSLWTYMQASWGLP